MDWIKQLPMFALAVVVCLGMTACAQERGEGSGMDTQPTSTPSVLSTPLTPLPTPREKGDETLVLPCGPTPQEAGGHGFYGFGDVFLEFTPDGSQLMFSYSTSIWIVDVAGTQLRMLVNANPRGSFEYGFHADISPDGTQVVFSTCDYPWDAQSFAARHGNALLSLPVYSPDKYDIALIDIDGGAPRRLTKSRYLDHFPVWSPDGSRIAYIHFLDSTRMGIPPRTIRTMTANGSEWQEVQKTRSLAIAAARLAWSPDGKKLAFLVHDWENWPRQYTLYTALANGSELRKVAENVVSDAAWSPNGQLIALARLVGEEVGLYTLAADGSDQKLIAAITDIEGYLDWSVEFTSLLVNSEAWSPDGTMLLYSCLEGACVIDVESGQSIGLVSDSAVRYRQPFVAAWSPDGSRIAIYTPGHTFDGVPAKLFTAARDGTDHSDLIRMDDEGNLVPANSPRE